MSNTVIKVENLSKQYRLGEVSTGTISHDVNRWWHKIRGKEDPYLKIGEANDRTTLGTSDYVWALKDINFEVKQGEVLGIIGRNGAGKSTLLKILSRTTAPTTGSVKIKGRVASLLEVGTGFHPELSGRENIYLNGAILGMTRHEITRKFDEIVAFAGVERYIDTPVKRYSSGMYVRLAFAVAAHLEPEILIVDEVLAVGDAEFQKKCLGKMKDVSVREGRTVLFVSHNMVAVEALCEDVIVIERGHLAYQGTTNLAISNYFARNSNDIIINTKTEELDFIGFEGKRIFDTDESISLRFKFKPNLPINSLSVDLAILNEADDFIIHIKSDAITNPINVNSDLFYVEYNISPTYLTPGNYKFVLYAYNEKKVFYWAENIEGFKISSKSNFGNKLFIENNRGVILPKTTINYF